MTADLSAAIRARLDEIAQPGRDDDVADVIDLSRALSVVLDLCDREVEWEGDEGDGPSGYVEVPELWRAIAISLGIDPTAASASTTGDTDG